MHNNGPGREETPATLGTDLNKPCLAMAETATARPDVTRRIASDLTGQGETTLHSEYAAETPLRSHPKKKKAKRSSPGIFIFIIVIFANDSWWCVSSSARRPTS